jgi:hypothetical protein
MAYEDNDYTGPSTSDDSTEAPSQPNYVSDPDILAQLNAPAEKPDYVSDPDLLARLNAPDEPAKPEGQGGAFVREIAHDIGPAAAGAVTGMAAAGAAGAVAGPVGGFVAGLAGGFAGGYGANVVQENAAKMLGVNDDAIRAANAKEHPWTVAAAGGLSNLVGFGRGAVSGVQRALSGGIGGAIATGQEVYQRGKEFFTPEGFKESIPNIVAQTAAGTAFPKPRGYVESAEQAGARWARPPPPMAPAAPPPPSTPPQGTFDFGQPGSRAAGGSREGQQMEMNLQPPDRSFKPYPQPELNLRTPVGEQGQLDLPTPGGPAAGRVNEPGARGYPEAPPVPPDLGMKGGYMEQQMDLPLFPPNKQGEASPAQPAGQQAEMPWGIGEQGQLPFPHQAAAEYEGKQPPHGTPGPQAAAGVAEPGAPPPQPGFGSPGHGPEDYGKKPPPQPGGGGVNVGPDPTLGAVFKPPEGQGELPMGPPKAPPMGAEAPPKPPLPPDIPAPPEPPKPVAPVAPAVEAPVAAAADNQRKVGNYAYDKNPQTGKWEVKDNQGNVISEHPVMGQAVIAANKYAKNGVPGAAKAEPTPVHAFIGDIEKDIKAGHYDANIAPTTSMAEFKAAAEARGWKEGPYGKGKALWSPDGQHVMFVGAPVEGNHLNVQWGEPGKGIKAPGAEAPAGKAAEAPAGKPAEAPAAAKRNPEEYKKLSPDIPASEYSQRMAELRAEKPRPVNKLWNDPSKAPPEQVAAQQAKIKAWDAEYRRVSNMQKMALARDNAAFAAKQEAATKPVEAPKPAAPKEPTAAELYKAGKPRTIDLMAGSNKKLRVMDETTLAEALDKHGTAKGLLAPLTKFMRAAVVKQVGKMPVYIIPHADMIKYGEGTTIGAYDRGQNHIFLNEAYLNKPERMAHAVLHEGLHAATVHAIIADTNLKTAFHKIMADVAVRLPKAELAKHSYGFFGGDGRPNAREFVAEAFSNPEFQQMLTEHQLSPAVAKELKAYFGQSPVKSAWDAIVNTVRKALGVPKGQMNALEAAMRATGHSLELNQAAKDQYLGTRFKDYSLNKLKSEDELERAPPGPSPKDPPMAQATKEDMETGFIPGLQRWLGVRASSTPSGRAARNIIMQAEGEAEQIRQKAHGSFTNAMHQLMNRTPEHEQRMLVNYIQGGKDFPNYQPSPELKGIVTQLRQIHQDFENKMRSMPTFDQMNFWDNDKYLSGQYKNTQQAQNFYRTYSENNSASGSGSTKKKFYPTDEDARRAGLVPISTNPIERVLRYTDAMSNYISYQQQIQNGKSSGYIKYFSPETVAGAGTPEPYIRGRPPDGWAPINGMRDAGGRQAYAPREFAETMNNFHSTGIRGSMPRELVDAIRRTSNTFTAMELGVATYHAFTTVHERIASEWSTALSKAASGDLAGAAKTFAQGVASPMTSVREANRIYDVYLGKAQNVTPSEKAIVDAMKAANYKPINAKHTLDYDMSKAGSLYTSYARGALGREMEADFKNIMGGNWKAGMAFVPKMAGRVMQTVAQPLFEAYIPRMKTSAFTSNVKAWMDANPNHTPAELQDAAIKIGKSVDNRMGEMAHDNMMMHRSLRDAASIVLRSFSFTIGGVFREIGGGALSLGRGALAGENRLALSSKNYDPRTAYAVAFPIAVASMSMLYQFLKTGKGPDEWRDLVWPETGGKQAGVGKGRQVPERALLPGYHKDIAAYIVHPTREAGNKLAGLWQAIGDQISGTKMTEVGPVPIVPPKATLGEAALARAKAFGEKATPIFARTATKVPQKATHISYPEQLMGLRAPGKWATDPVGQHIADDKRAEREWKSGEKRINADRASRGQAPLPPYRIPKEPRP